MVLPQSALLALGYVFAGASGVGIALQSGINATLGHHGGQAFASAIRCAKPRPQPLVDLRRAGPPPAAQPRMAHRGAAWRVCPALQRGRAPPLQRQGRAAAAPSPWLTPRCLPALHHTSFLTGLLTCLVYFAIDVTALHSPLPAAAALKGAPPALPRKRTRAGARRRLPRDAAPPAAG